MLGQTHRMGPELGFSGHAWFVWLGRDSSGGGGVDPVVHQERGHGSSPLVMVGEELVLWSLR